VPRSAQDLVATLIRTIFAQPDGTSVWAQLERVVDQLQARFPDGATALVDMAPDLLAFTSFPKEHWRQICRTILKSGSIKSSVAARMWSESFRTGPPSSVSSGRSWPSKTTNGSWPDVT
jgi:transposase-like protein